MTDWKPGDLKICDWEAKAIKNLMIYIETKERETKVLKERKMMEEADAALTEDLFSNAEKEEKKEKNEKEEKKEKKEKEKKPKELLEQKKQQLKENQKLQSQKIRDQNAQKMRSKELYGEADVDEYEELYGNIEDNLRR